MGCIRHPGRETPRCDTTQYNIYTHKINQMFFRRTNPVYNTVMVFLISMALIYLCKPPVLYDRSKQEFRQFGTKNGKTLLPVHIVSILIAIVLYGFFHHTAQSSNPIHPIHPIYPTDQVHPIYPTHVATQSTALNQQIHLLRAQLNYIESIQSSQANPIQAIPFQSTAIQRSV
jgi:hypothetical protein